MCWNHANTQRLTSLALPWLLIDSRQPSQALSFNSASKHAQTMCRSNIQGDEDFPKFPIA